MTTFQVALTELRQNKKLATALAAVALLLGVSLHLMVIADTAIKNLVNPVRWGADLAILPKGVTLPMLASELRTNKIENFLPEALFHTTVGMTQGRLRMTAVLPGNDDGHVIVRTLGDPSVNFAGWGLDLREWAEQSEHGTKEWDHKVIAAAFASGSSADLAQLKEVIDRKTVAQAVWVDSAQKAELSLQGNLSDLAILLDSLLLSALGLSLALAGFLFHQRHRETQRCLIDLGWSKGRRRNLQLVLLVTLLIFPMVIGFSALPAQSVSAHLSTTLPR